MAQNETLAVKIGTAVHYTKKDGWRGNRFKEWEVESAIREELDEYGVKTPEIFELVGNQREY